MLPVWQRLLLTLAAILGASFIAGLIWQMIFGGEIPGYVGGLVGGVAALPVWELSKRIQWNPGT